MPSSELPEGVEPIDGSPAPEPTFLSTFAPFATGVEEPGTYREMPDEPPAATLSPEEKATRYVVSVHASAVGKVGDYHWNNVELAVGDLCVVEDKNGLDYGVVAVSRRISPRKPPGCGKRAVAGMVVRKGTEEDVARATELARKEQEAMAFCRRKVFEEDLVMSVSRVSFSFDGTRAIFYFTSESRIDFRDLVRELSAFTRVKVEMRQIGVRDEARMIGGCGVCGGQLCCASFLNDFAPVSIRMAKDQNLSLNPAKISGVCGRLMCCLGYEHDNYKELVSRAPKMGKAIKDPHGEVGKVIQLNLLKERLVVVYEDGSKGEFGIEEVTRIPGGMAHAKEVVAKERREKAIAEGRDPDAEEEALKLQRESRAPRPRPERGPRPGVPRPPREQKADAPTPPRPEANAAGKPENAEGNAETRRRRNRRNRGGGERRPDDTPRAEQSPRPENAGRPERAPRPDAPRGDRPPRDRQEPRPPRPEGTARPDGARPPREPGTGGGEGEGQKRSRRRRRRPNRGEGPSGGGGE